RVSWMVRAYTVVLGALTAIIGSYSSSLGQFKITTKGTKLSSCDCSAAIIKNRWPSRETTKRFRPCRRIGGNRNSSLGAPDWKVVPATCTSNEYIELRLT